MDRAKRAIVPIILIMLMMVGCGSKGPNLPMVERAPATNVVPKTEPADDEKAADGEMTVEENQGQTMPDLYVIRKLDSVKENITVTSLRTGNETGYKYNLSTVFADKYGTYVSVGHFTPGTVVELQLQDNTTLLSVSISDDVWIKEDVSDYDIDVERGVFSIGELNYKLPAFLNVFSADEQVYLADIKEGDILSVTGWDKEVLSVSITTSNGILQLVNTKVFDGSWITIGQKIFAKITPEMIMPLTEGEYTVTVANNGYGGSTDIEIKRGETTVVDLSKLEGEGPKICHMRFAVANDNCKIYLDGGLVENNTVKDVTYGTHKLVITAEGYEDWKKTLVVNSETAEISIGLTSTSSNTPGVDKKDTDETDTDADDTGTEDVVDRVAERVKDILTEHDSQVPDSGALKDDDELANGLDYFSTISGVLGTLLQ